MYKTFIKKPLLIARLTTVLLTAAFLQVSAKSSALAINNATEVPQKTVTGKVTDDKGEALPGVTVKVKGTQVAVVTDPQGNYRITSPNDDATLVFSFIGFQTQEVATTGKTVVNVNLATQASDLEEVVVVAYGTQKRTSITSAVSTINPAEIKRNSVTDITNAIVGRTPGIRVTQTSSLPGRFDTQIDVRGYGGAFNIGATPLFVIDGVPRSKSDFDHMDANEIESFSVLKDASAAIYGVQGANGVILVTTRKGTAGKVQVNYTGQWGSQFIMTYPKLMSSYQHASTYDEMQFNDATINRKDPITPKFNYQQIQDWYNGKGTSVDWVRQINGSRSNQTQHNITFSGGSDKVKFFTSGGYLDEGGLLVSKIERSQKYNARQSVTAEIAKGVTFETNVDFVNVKWSGPNNGTARTYDLVRNTWGISPQSEVYLNGDPRYLRQFDDAGTHNPMGLINRDIAGFQDQDQKQFHTVTSLNWVVPYVKGLTAKGLIGWDTYNTMNIDFRKNFKQYQYDYAIPTAPRLVSFDHPGQSQLYQNYDTGVRNDVQFSLNYQKHFGKSNINALALYEYIYNASSSMAGNTTFAVDVNPALGSGIPSLAGVGGGQNSPNGSRSFIGRINYDYSGKYLLEAGGRYGGSSYFDASGRWGFFPYASAGWRISQEPFIQNNLKFVDNLKLRASYGTTGDDQGASGSGFPAFLTGFTYPRKSSFYANDPTNGNRGDGNQSGTVFGSSPGLTKGYLPKFVANKDITWYSSTTTDIGLEGSLFKGKLTFEADVFRRDRDGILGTKIVAIPVNFGADLPQVNLNSDRTQGFEFTLGTRQQSGEFNWGISANYSFTRSNYRYNEESPASNPYDNWLNKKTGRYTDFIRGWETDGQFQTQQEIYSYPSMIGSGNRNVLPGDIRYVDVNGNGYKDDNDKVILAAGGSKPRAYFGVTIDAQWRGFDLTMLIQGATSYNLNYGDALSKPFVRDPQDPITTYIDRWHHEDLFNQNSPWVPGRWPSTGARDGNNLDQASTFTVFNGSYLRIKQLQIGYTLPKKLLSKLNLNKVRVFASAFNLLTFTGKGLDFVDPEYNPNNQSTSSSSFNPPLTMNVTAGAQLTF